MNKTEFLKDTLDRVQEWINSADHKVSIFLAFQGIILTILIPGILEILKNEIYLACSFFDLPITLAGFVIFLASILLAIISVSPKLNAPKSSLSITYFGSITNMSASDYQKRVDDLTEKKYETELLNQVYINSKIASTKHTRFKYAVILFISGSIIMLLGHIIHFLSYGY